MKNDSVKGDIKVSGLTQLVPEDAVNTSLWA
jgi:hypothetical protein